MKSAQELSEFFRQLPQSDQRVAMIAASIFAGGVCSADDASGLEGHLQHYWEMAMENILTMYGMK